MGELKLAKLDDRTPVKLTVRLPPGLARALNLYAELYRETYGEAEPVEELVPAMLSGFLEADRAFAARLRKLPS